MFKQSREWIKQSREQLLDWIKKIELYNDYRRYSLDSKTHIG